MGGSGFTQTFAELDAAANRLSRLLRGAGVEPGDHVAHLHGEPRPLLRGRLGLPLRRRGVHRMLEPADQRRAAPTSSTTAQAKVFITSKYKADQAAEIIADTPGVQLRLMLDGTIDGYESYEAAVAAHDADAARRRPDRRHRHALLVGHHRPSEGGHSRVRRHAAGRRRRPASAARWQLLFGVTIDERLPVARAAVPRRAAAVLDGRAGAGRHRRGDGALRCRAVPRAGRAVPASRVSQVVPTMFVRMLKLPDEVRAQVRRVVDAHASSTPPRRARSRSRSR